MLNGLSVRLQGLGSEQKADKRIVSPFHHWK